MIVISKANKESRAQESGEECFNLQLLRKKSKEQKGESRPPTLCNFGSLADRACNKFEGSNNTSVLYWRQRNLAPQPPHSPLLLLLLLLIKTTHFDKRAKGTTQVQLRSRCFCLCLCRCRRSSCSQFQASTA